MRSLASPPGSVRRKLTGALAVVGTTAALLATQSAGLAAADSNYTYCYSGAQVVAAADLPAGAEEQHPKNCRDTPPGKGTLYTLQKPKKPGEFTLLKYFVLDAAPTAVPEGFLDSCDATNCYGWARLPGAENDAIQLDVHLYRDGPAGTGTIVSTGTANVASTDVGAHRFTIPHNGLPAGTPVFAHAIGRDTSGNPSNNNPVLGGSPQTVVVPPPPKTDKVLVIHHNIHGH